MLDTACNSMQNYVPCACNLHLVSFLQLPCWFQTISHFLFISPRIRNPHQEIQLIFLEFYSSFSLPFVLPSFHCFRRLFSSFCLDQKIHFRTSFVIKCLNCPRCHTGQQDSWNYQMTRQKWMCGVLPCREISTKTDVFYVIFMAFLVVLSHFR